VTQDQAAIESEVGNPSDRWEVLKDRVQAEAVQKFAAAQAEWLGLMWCLDAYRAADVVPRGSDDLAALNRNKGNWFSELVALLLQNQTSQEIGSRTKVQGFSQVHQVDVAWPVRRVDPLICVETKVTGGPPYGDRPPRGALSDWTNRRKELKFAATDLKLFRRQQETTIEHWDVWRATAPPRCYFIWAARLRTEAGKTRDKIESMANEAQSLINTYLEGAGIFGWKASANGGYEPVPLPSLARVTSLDDVLYRIATEIRQMLDSSGLAPDPVVPSKLAVDTGLEAEDEEEPKFP
jgi:hypothetical protein